MWPGQSVVGAVAAVADWFSLLFTHRKTKTIRTMISRATREMPKTPQPDTMLPSRDPFVYVSPTRFKLLSCSMLSVCLQARVAGAVVTDKDLEDYKFHGSVGGSNGEDDAAADAVYRAPQPSSPRAPPSPAPVAMGVAFQADERTRGALPLHAAPAPPPPPPPPLAAQQLSDVPASPRAPEPAPAPAPAWSDPGFEFASRLRQLTMGAVSFASQAEVDAAIDDFALTRARCTCARNGSPMSVLTRCLRLHAA